VRLEVLGQLKNPITSSGIELETFRLVAQCLKQLRYRVPLNYYGNELLIDKYLEGSDYGLVNCTHDSGETNTGDLT
jgi:hypothetical protein